MKLLCAFFVPVLLACAADQPANKKVPAAAPAKKAAKTKAKPKAQLIPKGAVKTGPNTYSYTDPAGKKWIYRETPFGMMRSEDVPADPGATAQAYANVTASDIGDSIRFERPSPFGPMHWERKKTELNEMERAVWEREQAKAAKQD